MNQQVVLVPLAWGILLLALVGRLAAWAISSMRAGKTSRAVWQLVGSGLGLAFGGLTYWTYRLPVLRGSAWSLKDTIIRAGAIVSGVLFILTVLAAALPWMLDRLEGRTFESFVGARHVRSQKSGFLTVISVLSICGVALSSCALSSVVSVMGGFSQDLKRKILGNNAHIVIDTTSQSPWGDSEGALAKIRALQGVVAATPVVSSEVMVSSPSNLAGVIVRGVEPSSIGNVIELIGNIEVGKFEYLEAPEKLRHLGPDEVIGIGPGGEQYLKGTELPPLNDPDLDPVVRDAINTGPPLRPGLIIGRELAKTLHVYVGDEVTLVSPLGDLGPMGVMPRTKKFRIAAIFFSGMYEYDASHVYALIDVAQDYFGMGNKISAIDVKVEDAERAEQLAPLLATALDRPELRVRDWKEINKNLFSALKLERFATFIILSIAIMVASFCIICTLLLMVTEKGKEIAILKAIGASDGAILRTFMTEGVIIGAIGTVFGVATGLAVCTGLSWFGLRLDPDVYYIDRLPINVSGWDFFTVAIAALSICTLATLYPAQAASKLRPVDGLRYE
jgi:lipoprotein-releasing system permease protein